MSRLPAIDLATASGDSKLLPVGAHGGLEKPEGRLGLCKGRLSLERAVRHGGAPPFREAVQEGVGS